MSQSQKITTRCPQCQNNIRHKVSIKKFKCPNCQSIVVAEASELSNDAQSKATTKSDRVDTSGRSVGAIPSQTQTEVSETQDSNPSGEKTDGELHPAFRFLANGTVLGVGAAIAANMILNQLPSLGLRSFGVYGVTRMALLGGIIFAGYKGFLHQFWKVSGIPYYDIICQPGSPAETAVPLVATKSTKQNQNTKHLAKTTQPTGTRSQKTTSTVKTSTKKTSTIVSDGNEFANDAQVPLLLSMPIFFGLLIGFLMMLVLSTLKSTLGMSTMTYLLRTIASIAGLAWLITFSVPMFFHPDKGTRGSWLLDLCSRASRLCVACGLLIGLTIWAEYLSPKEGWVRTATAWLYNETTKEPEIGPQVWHEATFLLVNPEHIAIGIKKETANKAPLYTVIAKAEGDAAVEAKRSAWSLRIPIVAKQPQLARKVYSDSEEGELLKQILAEEVKALWKPQQLLPASRTLSKFSDNRQRTRIGYALNNYKLDIETDKVFKFVDLIPTYSQSSVATFRDSQSKSNNQRTFTTETIKIDQLANRSEPLEELSDRDLEEDVDFLDYCLYHILNELQVDQSAPLFVYVDDVVADVNHGSFALQEYENTRDRFEEKRESLDQKIDRDLKYLPQQLASTKASHWFAVFLLQQVDVQEERRALELEKVTRSRREEKEKKLKQLDDQLQDIEKELQSLKEIVDQEHRLTGEIRSKLVRAHVPLLDRSDRTREILLTKVSGNTWLRKSDSNSTGASTSLSDEAMVDSGLATATHLLLTDIRSPDASGTYQLSMRLVNVSTGVILWEHQGDRTK